MGSPLLDWSRAQFALTACYHWLFVPLTLGLALVMAIMETIYVRTRDEFWKSTAQFWQKIFGINFAVGVATGLILEFEFGTNWSNYSWFVGDIFGAPLAIEGILAFFMEATFIAVMFFGWNKVSRSFHLASTWLTGVGATLSAWWILVANSWMQHPVGMEFNPETVRNEMMDFFAVAFAPEAATKFAHAVTSGWMTGAVFVTGVSCWYLLRRRQQRRALASIKVATVVGVASALLVMFTGDRSGIDVARHHGEEVHHLVAHPSLLRTTPKATSQARRTSSTDIRTTRAGFTPRPKRRWSAADWPWRPSATSARRTRRATRTPATRRANNWRNTWTTSATATSRKRRTSSRT